MARHRHQLGHGSISLPVCVEVTIFAVSLLVGVSVAAASFLLTVERRLAPIREAFGVDVNLAPFLPQLLPILGISGLFVGVKFHAAARRWLIGKLAFA